MNRFIVVGGIGVFLAIFAICFFIVFEVAPLFLGPSTRLVETFETAVEEPFLIGSDDWVEKPFVASLNGTLSWIDRTSGQVTREALPLDPGFKIRSWFYQHDQQHLVLGSEDGRTQLLKIHYEPVFSPDGSRRIDNSIEAELAATIGRGAIEAVALGSGETTRSIGAIEADLEANVRRLHVASYGRSKSLFGVGDFTLLDAHDLTALLPATPIDLALGSGGEELVVRLEDERLAFLLLRRGNWQLQQVFQPFPNGLEIATMDFLQGEFSLNLTSKAGDNVIYSLTPGSADGLRFVLTKTLDPLSSEPTRFSTSLRNKAYLLADAEELSLRYATTEKVRWRQALAAPLADLLLGARYDHILLLGTEGEVRILSLDDPHPEAGLRAFFGKIWYEGQDAPRHSWQSTGGSDDFEPKLSLIPLILGSLKGTFYALLFAVPIALLSAIYTSQFLRPSLKRIIKPTMEIMASLPSVVLGFLGALWLAPILESRVPSFLLLIVFILSAAVLAGMLWERLPTAFRLRLPGGTEFLVFFPILLLASWAGWSLGPVLEKLLFVVVDPTTGTRTADFRLWWSGFSGESFQQRNALVVGVMMGFAVIPIIFTLAEDALSNVPTSLVSGSLALGASRWQTTARVVLPGASAGIFSALMIGLGRAVGETMIVVMATGNTPIMDFDMFTGMRTLSANLAVELPEAPHGSTLYRTLFLGALVLFILTFIINTFAEILRHRLRNRYKVIS